MNCADCRAGEHINYDDDLQLVYVRDPDTKHIIKRAWLCREHRTMYELDGYEVKKC
jgi:hypothetical protein